MTQSNPPTLTKEIVSAPFLGCRSLGFAAPLAYFRSEEDWGVGDLDTLARAIDFARQTRQRIVQLLPLQLSISNNSPYSIASIYVMDPVYIGMRTLQEQFRLPERDGEGAYRSAGRIMESSSPKAAALRIHERATFEETRRLKYRVLHPLARDFFSKEINHRGRTLADALIGDGAVEEIGGTERGARFLSFCARNRYWLSDHILYFLLREEFHSDDFRQWPTDLALRRPEAIRQKKRQKKDNILFEAFLQWILTEQLALRYHEAGSVNPRIEIMLDQPFAFGNADVWTHPEAFHLSPQTLKREYTQGVPPHRLDIPQHWQFTLLRTNAAAKYLLLDRLHFLMQNCSLLRIDHLLGYYRVFFMSEDVDWQMTLDRMGAWEEVEGIIQDEASLPKRRERIYAAIVKALKKSLSVEVASLLFQPDGSLRKGSTILAARREFSEDAIDREATGWYQQPSVEHGQDLQYMLLNPNELGDTDYLAIGLKHPEYFLRSSDSIRVCFFQPGLGEEIIAAFLAAAQQAGKTLVAENLGEVPPEVDRSLQELGMPQFKPLYFGYQRFIGDPNDYWVDKITPLDCACFGYHDTVTLKGWWTGDGNWSSKKYYFRHVEQKQAVVDWLRERGYLPAGESVSLTEMNPALLDALLASVADSAAAMVVLQMPDLFGSGDEGVINIPGELGFWTTRAPVTIETLLRAAAGETNSPLAIETVARMRRLTKFQERDSLFAYDQFPLPGPPRIQAVHPQTGHGSKQIAFAGESFLVDVVVYGPCHRADFVLENGQRFSMDRLSEYSSQTFSTGVFRCILPVTGEWLGTHAFRICLENRVWSDTGFLIGLQAGTDSNPLSIHHGRVIAPVPESLLPAANPAGFLQELAEGMMPWIQARRWFLGKGGKITRVDATDGFHWEGARDACETIGLLIRVDVQTGSTIDTQMYYQPLHIFLSPSQAAVQHLSATPVEVRGRFLFAAPADHTLSYQRALLHHLAGQTDQLTLRGNRLVFEPSPAQTEKLTGEVRSARDLLADSSDSSTNVLTEVQMDGKTVVVKTFKRGADDIEAEVYAALWRQKYPHVLDGFGAAALVHSKGPSIPLCLVLKKLIGPQGLSRQESMAGFQAYKSFAASLRQWVERGASGAEEQLLQEAMTSPTDACCDVNTLLQELGEVLATLHIALAGSADAGFGVRAATAGDLKKLFHYGMQRGLQNVEEKIHKQKGAEYGLIRRFLPALRRTLVADTSRWLRGLPTINLTRIHGDMQAEQIMLDAEYRWIIIDLGGAPLLRGEERREKACASQDIAGILRAFGYIKFAALEAELRMERKNMLMAAFPPARVSAASDRVYSAIDFAAALERRFAERFMDSYLDTIEQQNATQLFLPVWDRGIAISLIERSTLLRAIYEMRYEVSARPLEEKILIPFETLYLWLIARMA